MNEFLFFTHIVVALSFLLGALYFGQRALVVLICLAALFANLFVVKQMKLFSLQVTCSDVYMVIGIWGLNLLQEYFGKKAAKEAITLSLAALFFMMVMSFFQRFYQPSMCENIHLAFQQILTPAPRICIASFIAFFITQKFDVFFFGLLSKAMGKTPLYIRGGMSNLVSQALDTLLFSFLGLYGVVSQIFSIMFVSYLIKVIIIFTTSLFVSKVRKIRQKESPNV